MIKAITSMSLFQPHVRDGSRRALPTVHVRHLDVHKYDGDAILGGDRFSPHHLYGFLAARHGGDVQAQVLQEAGHHLPVDAAVVHDLQEREKVLRNGL
jgi:hypothetical protein